LVCVIVREVTCAYAERDDLVGDRCDAGSRWPTVDSVLIKLPSSTSHPQRGRGDVLDWSRFSAVTPSTADAMDLCEPVAVCTTSVSS